jgi:Periplasmic copper-binding protein (NosD)
MQAGTMALSNSSTGWTSHHTLYVACSSSPAGSTYPDIASALAVVQPYTTIKVCAGMYAGNNVLNTSYVAIVGQGRAGAVTISCGTSPNPNDSSEGVEMNGSYDQLKNVTVNNCNVGAFISEVGGNVRADEVEDSFFNGDSTGILSQDCDDCEIAGNEVSNSAFEAIYIDFDFDDSVKGNEILGDGSGNEDGIYVIDSVSISIKSNRVSASFAGLDMEDFDQFFWVAYNTFNGNEYGVYVYGFSGATNAGNSGNTFYKNTADGNTFDGFFANSTNGANASIGQLPNRYLFNKAFGNGTYDYEDQTFPYSGSAAGTNDGTADFYHGNKGQTAFPGQILTS